MRSRFALALPFLLLAGCSVDTSGLGDDVVIEDTGDDTTISSDETGSLFDAEDDTAMPDSDATVEETAAEVGEETAIDSSVAETVEETLAETGADADAEIDAADSTLEAETSIDADLDSALPEASVDSAIDVVDSAPADSAPTDTGTTGGLVPAAGQVSCSSSGTTKLCAAGETCCGSGFTPSWSCSTSCGGVDRNYECDEKADCTGGKICCAKTAFTVIVGSDCRTSCALFIGSDPQLCMTNAECGGKTCTPQKAPDSPQTIGVCK